jgi:hypothetical protein
MAIDPNEIDSIEKSMVHDEDEEPKPEGWGIYTTLRFLSEVVLGVYGLMLFAMVVLQTVMRGQAVPIFFMPQSVLMGLPFALVAIYFYFVSDPEPDIIKKRTVTGRIVTFVIVFIVMRVISVLLWVAIAKSFSLH